MVDCGYCVACKKKLRKKKEYNLKRMYSFHKKEIYDHTYKVMLANWLRAKRHLFY
jgi:hypothetical protein